MLKGQGSSIVAAINLLIIAVMVYGGLALLLFALAKLAYLLDTNDAAYALAVGFLVATVVFLMWRVRK